MQTCLAGGSCLPPLVDLSGVFVTSGGWPGPLVA